jgi:hypothetical protein
MEKKTTRGTQQKKKEEIERERIVGVVVSIQQFSLSPARTQNKNRRRRTRKRGREKRCAPVATPSLSVVVAAHPPFASPSSLAAFSFFFIPARASRDETDEKV